jgi:GAF domain-containing protein
MHMRRLNDSCISLSRARYIHTLVRTDWNAGSRAMNQFLSGAERTLASGESVTTTLQRIARTVVPHLADFCFIFLASGADIRCAASAHATHDGRRLVRRFSRVYKITRKDPVSTVAHVLNTGRPRLRTEIRCEEAAAPATDPQVFTLHRRLGACSALVVPIGEIPNVLGAISLCYSGSGRHYTAQDLPIARRLAASTAAFLRKRAGMTPAQPHVPVVQRRTLRLRARV